jgi:hypothetical protein
MYPKLKINVYFIFLNIGDLTFGITFVHLSKWTVKALLTSYFDLQRTALLEIVPEL